MKPYIGERHRELRVDGDGALEMGNRRGGTTGEQRAPRGAPRLQSLQRRRGGLLERSRMLPDGAQRFAQPPPDLNRNPGKRTQDLLFSFRLRLFLAKDVSRAAVSGAKPQNIMVSQACNRAFQNGRAAGSFADLLRNLGSEPRFGRPVHKTQYLLDLL